MKKLALYLIWLIPAFTYGQNDPKYLRYIEQYSGIAVEQMQRYHIPASITLAQGLYESGAGEGELAKMSNNHFGIKCGTEWTGKKVRHNDDRRNECFRSYEDPFESYEDHSKFLTTRTRYASLFQLDIRDYKGWAYGLKKAGYATNPQYANKLIDLIEKYQLYRFDDKKYLSVAGMRNESKFGQDMVVANDKALNPFTHIVMFYNDTPYLLVRNGDTLESLAKEMKIKKGKLIKFNELLEDNGLVAGERIYLAQKKKHASEADGYIYYIKQGESMHDIAQNLGIQLKRLYKLNKMSYGDAMPKVGEILRIH